MMLQRVFVLLLAGVFAASAQVDPELLNLLPPDAKIAGGMRFDPGSPFGQYVLGQMNAHPEDLDALAAQTDFDPRTDLTEIVVGANNMGKESAGLMVGRGVFNVGRIVEHARAHGAVVSEYKDAQLITGDEERSPVMAFLGIDIVIAGQDEHVRAAVDRSEAGATLDPDLAARALALSTGKHGWMLMVGSPADLAGDAADERIGPGFRDDLIKAIEEMGSTILFGADVEVTLTAVTETPRDAEALANVVRFFASFMRMKKDDPMAELMRPVIAGMQLSTSGETVTLTLSMPEDKFEELLDAMHHRHPRREPGVSGVRSGRSSRTGRGR